MSNRAKPNPPASQDLTAQRNAWVQKHLARWPELSDERWQRLFGHFGLKLDTSDAHRTDDVPEDGQ